MQEKLKELIELLQQEKVILLQSARDFSLAPKLDAVRVEKERVLAEIEADMDEAQKFPELLEQIRHLSQINMELAMNSMQFIQQLFEAIFEEKSAETYGQNGEVTNTTRSIINKKA